MRRKERRCMIYGMDGVCIWIRQWGFVYNRCIEGNVQHATHFLVGWHQCHSQLSVWIIQVHCALPAVM
jgi:hypothetical protein